MKLRSKLSQRIDMDEIHKTIYLAQRNHENKKELYNLLFDKDERVAYNAAWIMTHFSTKENEWLYKRQDALIDEVLTCEHTGKRRLVLAILYKLPLTNPPRVDFLDFCLQQMISKAEPFGIQALCMKIAYELCRPIPELRQELKIALEMMEGELSPAVQATKKSILKAMSKGKSLQKI